MADVRMCDWCEVREAVVDRHGPMVGCELRGCEAAFCDSPCADFHMGKHEDWGECERDRDGNVVRDRTRRVRVSG